ncbi:hypothetical protein BDF19DRAFT_421333 [Syncephalis fuscata]|nr:hypothetical protein BDF19DRAFT_421333 [Syncephalis fuscata]
MALPNPVCQRPPAIPIDIPSWNSYENAQYLRKYPSSPGLGIQNTFVIVTDARRSSTVHQVSDAAGQALCTVKRGGRLRRRRLRRAVTTNGQELNWSLYMPKDSKGFPRFLWCGGRKSERKDMTSLVHSRDNSHSNAIAAVVANNNGSTVQGGQAMANNSNTKDGSRLSYEPLKLGTTSFNHHNNKMASRLSSPLTKITNSGSSNGEINVFDEAILASATAHGRSMSSSGGRGSVDCTTLSSNTSPNFINASNNYCPLGISSQQGVKLKKRNSKQQQQQQQQEDEQQLSSIHSNPYSDTREILIETCFKEYIKNLTKTRLAGDNSPNNENNDNNNSNNHRLLYFHWKAAEYSWRWNPMTRRLDCLCTRANHQHHSSHNTSNRNANRFSYIPPLSTPLRTPQAAMSTPSLSLSAMSTPSSVKLTLNRSNDNTPSGTSTPARRPTSMFMHRESSSSNSSSSGGGSSNSIVGGHGHKRRSMPASAANSTMIIASISLPSPSNCTTTSLEFIGGRCHDLDLEQMLLLSSTLLLEQLAHIDLASMTSATSSPNPLSSISSTSHQTVNSSGSIIADTMTTNRNTNTANNRRLSWFTTYRTQRRKSSCESDEV